MRVDAPVNVQAACGAYFELEGIGNRTDAVLLEVLPEAFGNVAFWIGAFSCLSFHLRRQVECEDAATNFLTGTSRLKQLLIVRQAAPSFGEIERGAHAEADAKGVCLF